MRRLVVACGLLLVAACGAPDPSQPSKPPPTRSSPAPASPVLSEPERAVAELMRALEDGDCPKARKLVLTPGELDCDVVEQAKVSFAEEGIDLDETTYRGGRIYDGSTTVTITWDNEYPPESYDVQKVRAGWKILFDSAA